MEAFFLPAQQGQRFCVYHAPSTAARGNILYVHPFAEEMNKARRMAALQARAFAQAGYGVLMLDLTGCGDSSGDFSDASWECWKQDLALGAAWLQTRHAAPLTVWGLRLGALLALDGLASKAFQAQRLLLWQPVVSGATFMTQFLRLRLANDMLAGATSSGGVQALRTALQNGETLEIAGYELSPGLALAIDKLHMEQLAPALAKVYWLEIVAEAGRKIPPAAQAVAHKWRAAHSEFTLYSVACEPFWTTQEIVECPGLIHATSAQLAATA